MRITTGTGDAGNLCRKQQCGYIHTNILLSGTCTVAGNCWRMGIIFLLLDHMIGFRPGTSWNLMYARYVFAKLMTGNVGRFAAHLLSRSLMNEWSVSTHGSAHIHTFVSTRMHTTEAVRP